MSMTEHLVPREVLDLAISQRDAALQMLAAMFLTETEAATMPCEGNDEGEVGVPNGWVEEMRTELVGPARGEVLSMLAKVRVMTNSHAGYPLAAFRNPDPTPDLCQCVVDLRRFCEEYVAQDAVESYTEGWLEQQLLAAGYAPPDVRFAIQETGGAEPMAMLRHMGRMAREKQTGATQA